jgi:glutathione S-transferase
MRGGTEPVRLLIANKNYSSWSMRPWVLMRALGLPFEELRLRFDFTEDSPFRQAVARVSPAGKVPVLLLDDGFAVWDTQAITETLADLFPAAGVWPAELRPRARARSVCAEMHAGFGALRQHCPMNIEAQLPEVGAQVWARQAAVRLDLARIEQLWDDALQASGGPFLFGAFGAADACYAPVAMRLLTYVLPMSPLAAGYVQRLSQQPAVADWCADARAEHDFIAEDEPYRRAP